MFLDRRESTEFKSLGGKWKTVCTVVNINTVATTIEKDHHQSVQSFPTELKISQESIRCFLTGELGMKRRCLVLVPHFLRMDELQAHFYACTKNITIINEPEFLTEVITTDE